MGFAIIMALGGYAIGTFQVLALDWIRARRQHTTQLRLLRSELRRARIRSGKFGWVKGQVPGSDSVPEPPVVSDVFTATVASVDFYLTDEFDGDNTQEALFGLLDGMDQLRRYRDAALKWFLEPNKASDPAETRKNIDRAYGSAEKYDQEVDVMMFMIDSALEDNARRL